MRDWRRLAERWDLEIQFYPNVPEEDPTPREGEEDWESYERRREEERERIEAALQPDLKAIRVEAHEYGKAAGGGPPDILTIVLAALGAYASARVLADDVRTALRRLGEELAKPTGIDETIAMLLAWDQVAPPGSAADVVLQHIGNVSPVNEDGQSRAGGWVVGFLVDGEPLLVIVAPTGEIVGTTPGFDNSLLANVPQVDDSGDEDDEASEE